jgi:hypothetical protein
MRVSPGSAALAVLAVALVAAVGVLVVGGERLPSVAAAPAQPPVLGRWAGTATSSYDGGAVRVSLSIDGLDGFADGRLREWTDAWRCGGSLGFSHMDAGAFVFRYTEEHSADCIASSVVSVRVDASERLAFHDAALDSTGEAVVIAGELRARG